MVDTAGGPMHSASAALHRVWEWPGRHTSPQQQTIKFTEGKNSIPH